MKPSGVPLVALVGNPNTGKTSLFNALTGQRAQVGNYPGITVDRREGRLLGDGPPVRILDVPGTLSLSARSPEEMIALEATLGLGGNERPDLVVLVADATRAVGTLYLPLQVRELSVPAVLALNLADEAGAAAPDPASAGAALGLPCVAVSARTGQGLPELVLALRAALAAPPPAPLAPAFPPEVVAAEDLVLPALPDDWRRGGPADRALARWALLSLDADDELRGVPPGLRAAVDAARAAAGVDLDLPIVRARYALLDAAAAGWAPPPPRTLTARVDAVLLHPVAGLAVFLAVMATVFQALFAWSDPLIGLIEDAVAAVGAAAAGALPPGLATDLLVEGLIGGVGNVVVFLPQIALLFTFIGLLEASGYMARAAWLMDRLMRAVGLNGRAFVPMLSGFACAVPAILATRTMERRRDRILTMMVIPLMTCSARLPVYTLIIGALFPPEALPPGLQGWPVQAGLMVAMYLFSVLMALAAAAVLGRTVLKGPKVPLLMELPPYRMPQLRSLAQLVRMRSAAFLREAGTVILAFTVLMWGLLTFPRLDPPAAGFANDGEVAAFEAARLEHSAAGRVGKAIEPVIRPLGFDWKIGVGLIGAFAAREVFISTMGLVYGIGEDVDEESPALRERMAAHVHADGRPVYTPLMGLSLLVFFALAAQCMSTLAVLKRETAGYGWPAFLFVWMTSLAWVSSFVLYQGGRLLGFG
jgi:ferrous iron transport protein B